MFITYVIEKKRFPETVSKANEEMNETLKFIMFTSCVKGGRNKWLGTY